MKKKVQSTSWSCDAETFHDKNLEHSASDHYPMCQENSKARNIIFLITSDQDMTKSNASPKIESNDAKK